jgi:hypothetical protein
LKDLKIESYEIIHVWRKPAVAIPRIKLLNKKNELIPEAKAIFQSWFNIFCNENRVITPPECLRFIIATTNTLESMIDISDGRIKGLFKDFAIKNPNEIDEEEFLRFYTIKSLERPDAVWSNLTNMRYGNDLRHIYDINNPDDPRELKNIEALPRSKLSSEQSLFRELIALLNILPPSSQDEIGGLINQLKTNPVLYAEMLTLKSLDSLSIKHCTSFEILYRLQIIESFVNEF